MNKISKSKTEQRLSEITSLSLEVNRSPSASRLDDVFRKPVFDLNDASESRRTSSASDITVIARDEHHALALSKLSALRNSSGQSRHSLDYNNIKLYKHSFQNFV